MANLGKIRNDIKRQVRYINDSIVAEVHRQGSIPASYQEINNWLYYGDSHFIAKRIAREQAPTVSDIRKRTIEHHEQNLLKYEKEVEGLQKYSSSFNSSSNKCKWVPTVNNRKEENGYSRLHYGGVSLTPKAVKVNLPKPGYFSGCKKVKLTPSAFSSYRTTKPPSLKVFNPPNVKATNTSGTQQATSSSGSFVTLCKEGNYVGRANYN